MLEKNTDGLEMGQTMITNIRKLGAPLRNAELSCVYEIVESSGTGRKGSSTSIIVPSITRGIESAGISTEALEVEEVAPESMADSEEDTSITEREITQENQDVGDIGKFDEDILAGIEETVEYNNGMKEDAAHDYDGEEVDAGNYETADDMLTSLQERIKRWYNSDGTPVKNSLDEGIRLHDLAVAGNKKAVRKAQQILRAVCDSGLDNAIAEGYYGSSLGLVYEEPLREDRLFEQMAVSLRYLGRAVERDPMNVQLRLLRVNLYHRFLEHSDLAIKNAISDLHQILEFEESSNHLLDEDLCCFLLFNLGLDYLRIDDKNNGYGKWIELLDRTTDPKYQTLVSLYLYE